MELNSITFPNRAVKGNNYNKALPRSILSNKAVTYSLNVLKVKHCQSRRNIA